MERKIGETFEYEGKTFRVKEDENYGCHGCFFYKRCTLSVIKMVGQCDPDCRTDGKSVIFVEVQEQPQEQAEQPKDEQPQLNLCEILKHCPQGEQFWSPMLGDVMFYDINRSEGIVRVEMENGEVLGINANGTITICGITSPEIMLFPSREQRDWTKVKYEEKKERFDPKTLKPFDRVLGWNPGTCKWECNLFSNINDYAEFNFKCFGVSYKHCIPYNDDTKHLVGTKYEAPDFYKYWED